MATTKTGNRPNKPQNEKEKKGFFARIARFFRELRSELKLVSWPNKAKMIQSSLIVFFIIIFSAVLIFVTDTIVNKSLTAAGFYNVRPAATAAATETADQNAEASEPTAAPSVSEEAEASGGTEASETP